MRVSEDIEKIARIMCRNSYAFTCKACSWGDIPNCKEYQIAEKLYNSNCRIIDEDKVVITKEQLEILCENAGKVISLKDMNKIAKAFFEEFNKERIKDLAEYKPLSAYECKKVQSPYQKEETTYDILKKHEEQRNVELLKLNGKTKEIVKTIYEQGKAFFDISSDKGFNFARFLDWLLFEFELAKEQDNGTIVFDKNYFKE